jgi:hypothetical protein
MFERDDRNWVWRRARGTNLARHEHSFTTKERQLIYGSWNRVSGDRERWYWLASSWVYKANWLWDYGNRELTILVS